MEAKFQTKFSRWLQYAKHGSAVYELKYCKGNALPFSDVKEHQERALLLATTTCINYKIPDVGMAQKPFDCFAICNVPAYVVIQFHRKGNKTFYMILITTWLKEKKESVKRSLTEDRCQEIGFSFDFPDHSQD